MQNPPELNALPVIKSKHSRLKTAMLVVVIAVATSVLTAWLMTRYLFPKEFEPVMLDAHEKQALDVKIDRLDPTRSLKPSSRDPAAGLSKSSQQPTDTLEPEPYSEAGARREVMFTERELNSLLATNTDLARKLAIDLSENLASAKLLVPLDPDLPLFGGKTLKVTAGLELRFAEGKPVVALKGVSVWGIPIPNAWLGGIKNVNLVREFGGRGGFWQAFAAGVEDIRVEKDRLTVRLKD
jgi:hypothetical protein